MSDVQGKTSDNGKSIIPVIVISVLLIGGLFLMTQFVSANRDRAINRSPVGMSALPEWLLENDVPARLSHRRIHPALADLSLRVMPLYDLDLAKSIEPPASQQERLENGELRDATEENYTTKISELPTLVVLPKWRGAAAELELLHEQALIPIQSMRLLMAQIGLGVVRIERAGARFSVTRSDSFELALFHAQTFSPETLPDHCSPEVMAGENALIIRCEPAQASLPFPVRFLADPDLLNNHGLGLSDNAEFAVSFLNDLRAENDRPIYVDVNSEILTLLDVQDEGQDYNRGSEELSRFFQYPFTVFWAMFLIVVAVTYWRGAFRFGPITAISEPTWDQSKGTAIAAKARLLRLSGNDGAIVADFVAEQLRTLSTDVLGHDQPDDGGKRFFQVVAKRDAALAQKLSVAAENLMAHSQTMSPQELDRQLFEYHSILKKVVDPHGSD